MPECFYCRQPAFVECEDCGDPYCGETCFISDPVHTEVCAPMRRTHQRPTPYEKPNPYDRPFSFFYVTPVPEEPEPQEPENPDENEEPEANDEEEEEESSAAEEETPAEDPGYNENADPDMPYEPQREPRIFRSPISYNDPGAPPRYPPQENEFSSMSFDELLNLTPSERVEFMKAFTLSSFKMSPTEFVQTYRTSKPGVFIWLFRRLEITLSSTNPLIVSFYFAMRPEFRAILDPMLEFGGMLEWFQNRQSFSGSKWYISEHASDVEGDVDIPKKEQLMHDAIAIWLNAFKQDHEFSMQYSEDLHYWIPGTISVLE